MKFESNEIRIELKIFTLFKNSGPSGTSLVRGLTFSLRLALFTQISKPPAFFRSGNFLRWK